LRDVIALFTACYHGNAIDAPLAAWRTDRCLATRNNIRNSLVACVYSITGVFYLATRHNNNNNNSHKILTAVLVGQFGKLLLPFANTVNLGFGTNSHIFVLSRLLHV
jgi:hypothetical protein